MNASQTYDAIPLSEPWVQGLPASYADDLHDLFQTWSSHRARNILRTNYYEGKNRLKDLGISIPPQLTDVDEVVGWPAKAVDSLAQRSRFDGFVTDGASETLGRIVSANRLKVNYRAATRSELTHGCMLWTVLRGEGQKPGSVIRAYSANNSAIIWDYDLNRIKCAIVVGNVDRNGHVTSYIMFEPESVVTFYREELGWRFEIEPHAMGRPMCVQMAATMNIDKPLGRSRITRSVMSITDNAVRECLRTEISSEFYTSPQRVILGTENKLIGDGEGQKPAWQAYVGSVLEITKDDDGDVPTFQQAAQMSMQPHTDYFRSLAAQFSGETNVPISQLGIIHDNPASAEALSAANEPLIIDAEDLNEVNGNTLTEIATMALAIVDNSTYDEASSTYGIVPMFRNPNHPSIASVADAWTKLAGVADWITATDVFWEQLGLDEATRNRVMSDYRRTHSVTTALLSMQQQAQPAQQVQQPVQPAQQPAKTDVAGQQA